MMINKILKIVVFTEGNKNFLKSILPHESSHWDNKEKTYEEINEIKISVREQMIINQNQICAYCGLDLGGTSDGQIEHIAPKYKYPQFTFSEQNLVMACHYCNGWSKKGRHDTVSKLDDKYESCDFKLVHPVFDEPADHYDWVPNEDQVLIIAKTDKGRYSINMLKLDESKMSELRAEKIAIERMREEQPEVFRQLIDDALNHYNKP